MQTNTILHKCFGILSTDPGLAVSLQSHLAVMEDTTFTCQFCDEPEKAVEFLNYELPDIVIVDLEHPIRDLDKIQRLIKEDPWLTGISVIGLYSSGSVDFFQEVTRWNLAALVMKHEAESIRKVLQAVMRSRSMLVDSTSLYTFRDNPTGEIYIQNNIAQAEQLANQISSFLYESNRIDKNKYYSINMGLSELLINAIEHGNCEISFSDKSTLLEQGINMVDHVKKLAQSDAFKDRTVKLRYEIHEDKSLWEITDMGSGFDVSKYTIMDQNRLFLSHGRGIMMAKNSSDELYYNEKGNQVTLVCYHNHSLEYRIPLGFRDEERVTFEPGDFVFREGEESTNLYYILTGEFKVLVKGKIVGSLSSADMFMGEMSFLLNNRRSASVIAASSAQLLKISKKSFIGIIKKYPNYMILLSRLLAMRLSRVNSLGTPQSI